MPSTSVQLWVSSAALLTLALFTFWFVIQPPFSVWEIAVAVYFLILSIVQITLVVYLTEDK